MGVLPTTSRVINMKSIEMFETQILDSFHMPVLTGSQNSYSCGNNFRGIWFVWHYSQIPSRSWLKHTGKTGVWTLKNLHISYVPKTLQGQDGTGRITRLSRHTFQHPLFSLNGFNDLRIGYSCCETMWTDLSVSIFRQVCYIQNSIGRSLSYPSQYT